MDKEAMEMLRSEMLAARKRRELHHKLTMITCCVLNAAFWAGLFYWAFTM